jgi:NADH dehydrogenase
VRAIDGDATRLEAAWLAGCDAIVNLVGIKMPQGDNDFAGVHERAVSTMIAAAKHAGVRRFVHVGVVRPPDARGLYHDTKRRGEALVRESGLDWTIVRPSVVYGPGDDMLTHLVQQLRVAPVFPIPGGELGPLMPVDVRDVAEAIACALERPASIGHAYDVVGPERLDVRALVRRVASALELPTLTPTMPLTIMRPIAAIAERVLADPPVTTSQLEMLRTGLPGDGEAAERELGLHPRRLGDARIAELAATIPSRVPSLRLVTSAEHRAWLERAADPRASGLLVGVLVAMLAMPWVISSIWPRMAVIEGVFAALAIATLRLPWRELLRPRASLVIGGVLGALALWLLGAVALALAPAPLRADVSSIYAWTTELPTAITLPTMLAIVAAEDIVWRGAVTFALAAWLGALRGCLAAGTLFAIAHLTSGPPLLWLAALAYGTLWSATAIHTRSLVAVITMHASWDTLAMFVLRYD